MEGFLLKKGGKGDSTFGRRTWKRRWFILEKRILQYYEGFDRKLEAPGQLKGALELVENSDARITSHREKKNVLVIEIPGQPPFYVCADDERTMRIWLTSLKQACSGDFNVLDYNRYYELLGLKEANHPTVSDINRAYRKAALYAHPDKGGDITEFKKLQEASEVLISKLEEEENEKLYDELSFCATIQKGGKGVGFGMVVVEDAKRGFIYIKEVLPTMKLQALDDSADGELQPNDRIIAVGNDDVRKWSLPRIVQRLNDFRVPVNSDVTIKFLRKVKKTEETINVVVEEKPETSGYDDDIDESEYYNSPQSRSGGSSEIDKDKMKYGDDGDDVDDECVGEDDDDRGNTYGSHYSQQHSNNNNNNGYPRTPGDEFDWEGKGKGGKSKSVHPPNKWTGATPLKTTDQETSLFLEAAKKETAVAVEKLKLAEAALVNMKHENHSLAQQLKEAIRRETELKGQLASLKKSAHSNNEHRPAPGNVNTNGNNSSNNNYNNVESERTDQQSRLLPGSSSGTVKIKTPSSSSSSSGGSRKSSGGAGTANLDVETVRNIQSKLSGANLRVNLSKSTNNLNSHYDDYNNDFDDDGNGNGTGSGANSTVPFQMAPRSALKLSTSSVASSSSRPFTVKAAPLNLSTSSGSTSSSQSPGGSSGTVPIRKYPSMNMKSPSNSAVPSLSPPNSSDSRKQYMASSSSTKTLRPSMSVSTISSPSGRMNGNPPLSPSDRL